MAWFWFGCFVCAVGYIAILLRGGAIDKAKAEASIEQSVRALGDAVDAGVAKGKEQIDNFRSKDKPQ